MPLPETAPEEASELIFTPGPEERRPVVKRPPAPPPPTPTADILAQLSQPKPAPEAPAEPVFAVIDEADRDERIELVLKEILEDADSSFRTDAMLYQDFLVRCRIRRVPGEPLSLPAFRRRLAVARAGVDNTTASSDGWQQALELSATVPDDVQGVFLVVAQAAVTGAPCPSDAALARAYGTHSARRARRVLTYFEERGLVGGADGFSRQPRRRLPRPRLRNRPGRSQPAGRGGRRAIRCRIAPVRSTGHALLSFSRNLCNASCSATDRSAPRSLST